MRKIIPVFLLIAFFSQNLYAQKTVRRKKHINAKEKKSTKKTIVKYGVASFYAKKFEGRSTRNDEIYNSAKYTAACNVLPLGTWIKVTNLRNHRTVIVRINDRMNHKNKRLVDLSRAAARDLGFLGRGVAKVKVEVLNNFRP
ncbi:septal ring lytic transglycosylase RlpA family protein [Ginsengibacter hankyongi]|uniref:Probable endolytic peptidoglycan transglycosylase RlpA n=1 Tax=Ginsengibacter hankyongi TaxID=2607284 RepID=A0A5J5ILC7_9BACT|nr:septal ring lytic transglycosylase RlpA family protein [Ginsengibacter hankyongi]KAA9041163.1 septal ring lytic transglycosylase RlpA family protein [Ginsengibacter hankyongi]